MRAPRLPRLVQIRLFLDIKTHDDFTTFDAFDDFYDDIPVLVIEWAFD